MAPVRSFLVVVAGSCWSRWPGALAGRRPAALARGRRLAQRHRGRAPSSSTSSFPSSRSWPGADNAGLAKRLPEVTGNGPQRSRRCSAWCRAHRRAARRQPGGGEEGVGRRRRGRGARRRSTGSSPCAATGSRWRCGSTTSPRPSSARIATKKFEWPPPRRGGSPTRSPTRSCSSSPGEAGSRRHQDRLRERARRGQGALRDGLRRGGPRRRHVEPVPQPVVRRGAPTRARSRSRRTCAGYPVSLPALPVRAAARAGPRRLPRDQHLAGVEPRRALVALTLSKDGNPEIYVLNVATGAFRRLTTHPGIDTEPTWSPNGREHRVRLRPRGPRQVFVMDAEGANVRRLTQGGVQHAAALVAAGRHDRLHLAPGQPRHLGGEPRRLRSPPAHLAARATTRAPRGRPTVAISRSTRRASGARVFTMLADGSEQQPLPRGAGEATSPSWSPRLP